MFRLNTWKVFKNAIYMLLYCVIYMNTLFHPLECKYIIISFYFQENSQSLNCCKIVECIEYNYNCRNINIKGKPGKVK